MMLFQREAGDSWCSKGMAHFDTHQVGCVWKGGLSGVVGGRAPATTQSRFTPRNSTQQTKGTTHFDTHQMGCVEGRVVRRVGGRAPTPTQPLKTSHQSSSIRNIHNHKHEEGTELRSSKRKSGA